MGTSPFITQFAEPIRATPEQPFRYDSVRQVGQTFQHGQWQDSLDAAAPCLGGTRQTEVRHETTDDR